MKIGDFVTITIDYPAGTDERHDSVLNETGMIIEYEKNQKEEMCRIATGNPFTTGWWFGKEEFREATEKEIRTRLAWILERDKT